MATATAEKPSLLIIPAVCLSGSGRVNLMRDNRDSHFAVDTAYEALANAGPHPRDYQGRDGDYQIARDQHQVRLAMLHKIRTELDEIAVGIDSQ